MPNTYNIGDSKNHILLQAQINTVGLAASRAVVFDVSGTDPGTAVAHSVDATGNISLQSIGDFSLLKGLTLSVFTKISLTGSDIDSRRIQAASIMARYKLSGGDDGPKQFSNPNIDYNDPNVFLNCIVSLT